MVIIMSKFRDYDPKKDREAVHRIWKEIGWLEKDQEKQMDTFIDACRALVADIDGEAECQVLTVPGTVRYLDEDLPFSCVASVGTSRIARKQGFAGRLTALAVARDANEEVLIAGLGMFEQGFYNRLGFGTGSYEHWASFDPASITVNVKARVPTRLTKDDWKKVHESRIRRKRSHGACNLHAPKTTKAEMGWSKKSFGLGYFDGPNGELTHHVWLDTKEIEHGPYWVRWMAYQNEEQFLELMALIKNLGDQIRLISICEPTGIQLQDLIDKPFKRRQITEKSKYENRMNAFAYWQMRILDLRGCMEKTHLSGEAISFNLELIDPIEDMLDDNAPWRGISGDYVVTLGPQSRAEEGKDEELPTLRASVGAFTRMWLGVRPASGLAVTDDLSGPKELLESLDLILRIPTPHPDWDF
ncbi:MAG: GNAT family N-acetyltransferase [Methanomicrobia archaeon]|nr:GNAT family N-acetyltransferase [Methanomicrobia archaeon]